MLKRILDRRAPSYSAKELDRVAISSSDSERRAMAAERQSVDLGRAFVAQGHIGETFRATIAAVQAFGLFVAIDEPFIEGLVPVQSLPQDYYEMDEFSSMLVGQNSGRRYVIGDPITVQIASVSLSRRQVEMRLEEAPTSDLKSRAQKKSGAKKGKKSSAWRAKKGKRRSERSA
jgi:ribonuclease R